ncbi:hypothetical protein [Maricaulis sp.]|uniref:hypothetical protein n=1 Tax=Maricaulis sp. TaxID=1486257 RepID=UPI002B274F6C|nr:hypothetical protein [Maricaulis sp.]
MILSRLSRAIRQQNWFAVVLEFVIVVAGVLLAFQISQFASARSERAYALDAMARVETDVREIMAFRNRTRAALELQLEQLAAALSLLDGDDAADSLTPEQCQSMATSSYISMAVDAVPTLDEVRRSGALAAIDNEPLRLAILRFSSRQDTTREYARRHDDDVIDLTTAFPEVIRLERVPAPEVEGGWTYRASCDLAAMRASPALQASVTRNHLTAHAFGVFVFGHLDEAFETLHAALDAELGLIHADTEPAP